MERIANCCVWFCVFVAASEGARGSAECPNGANLLTNCGFETDVGSWVVTADSGVSTTFDAHGGDASVEIDAAEQFSGPPFSFYEYRLVLFQCVSAPPTDVQMDVGAWFKLVSFQGDQADLGCVVDLTQYSEGVAPCSPVTYLRDSFSGVSSLAPTQGTWIRLSHLSRTVRSDAKFLSVAIRCDNLQGDQNRDFLARVDDAYLMLSPAIFVDGFDYSYDSCEWSSSTEPTCAP